jgi:hypothetical protein
VSDRPGIKSALASADQVGSRAARADAPETLPLPGFEAAGDTRGRVLGGMDARRPGRPAGSRNLRNQALADFIFKTEGDPLLDVVRLSRMSLLELAQELRAVSEETGLRIVGKNQSLLDLVKLQRDAGIAALPYLHQKQPLAIQMQSDKTPVLIIGAPTPEQIAQAAQSMGLDLRAELTRAEAETVEYQDVSEGEGEPFPNDAFPNSSQLSDIIQQSGEQAGD